MKTLMMLSWAKMTMTATKDNDSDDDNYDSDDDDNDDDDDEDDDDNFSGCRRASSHLTPLTRCKHALQRWPQKLVLPNMFLSSHSHTHTNIHTPAHTHI